MQFLQKYLTKISSRINDDDLTNINTTHEAVKILSIFFFSAMAIVLGMVFSLVNLLAAQLAPAIAELIFAGGVALNLAAFIFHRNIKITVFFLLLVSYGTALFLVINGGIDGTGFIWTFMFPVVALLLAQEKQGTIWSVFLIVSIVGVLALDHYGYIDTYYTSVQLRQLTAGLSAVTLLMFIHGLVSASIRKKSNRRSQELKDSYEKIKAEVTARTQAEAALKKSITEKNRKNRSLEKLKQAMSELLSEVQQEKEKIEELSIRDEALLKSIGDGMVATDRRGHVVKYNKRFLEILGLKEKDDIIGKNIASLLKSYDKEGKRILRSLRPEVLALKSGGIERANYTLRCQDGNEFNATVTAAPFIVNNKAVGAVVTVRDTSMEASIDKVKTEFVSLASHQLRTPLTAINWYVEMLLNNDAGKLNSDQEQFLEEIYRANQRMVTLVDSLLDVSRVDMGTFIVDPLPTDINHLAEEAIEEQRPQFEEKHQQVTIDCDPDLPTISTDPKLTYIIFQNLLSNASKYTPDKGRISLNIAHDESDIIITVKDEGYGIPQEQQHKIFTKLFRADNVVAQDTNGTGLGLYITKAIVEEAGGTISFESEEGQGTTFKVTLPKSGMKRRGGSRALFKR